MSSNDILKTDGADSLQYASETVILNAVTSSMIDSNGETTTVDVTTKFIDMEGWQYGMWNDANSFTDTVSSQWIDVEAKPSTTYKIRDFTAGGDTFVTVLLEVDSLKERVAYLHTGTKDEDGYQTFTTDADTVYLRIMKRADSSTYGDNELVEVDAPSVVKKQLNWLELVAANYGDLPPFYNRKESFDLASFMENKKQKPILTWVDDDVIPQGIVRVKDICDTISEDIVEDPEDTIFGVDYYTPTVTKIKATLGCVTDTLIEYDVNNSTWAYLTSQGYTDHDGDLLTTLKRYQTEGFHIANHSKTHGAIWNDGEAAYSVSACEADMLLALEVMKANQFFDCDMVIYPFGTSTDGIQSMTKKWCRCGVRSNAFDGTNEKYADGEYSINRIFIKNTGDYWTIDEAEYKSIIDNAFSKNAWLVFGTHSYSSTEFNENLIRRIMKYALSLGFEIMPLNEAYKYNRMYYIANELYNTPDLG